MKTVSPVGVTQFSSGELWSELSHDASQRKNVLYTDKSNACLQSLLVTGIKLKNIVFPTFPCLIGLCSVLRPRQHSIGYNPTNSIKVLKEYLQRKKIRQRKQQKNRYAYTIIDKKGHKYTSQQVP